MSDPTAEPATSSADERRRIWGLYEAHQLDSDQATRELLRIDMADRRAKRATLPPGTP
jgi:hypothetical protein